MQVASPSISNASSIEIHYVVLKRNTSKRRAWVQDMRDQLGGPPRAEILQAVNGFDARETIDALRDARLKYHIHTYCGFTRFGTYGSLACFLTKVRALVMQVERRIPFVAMLEDDMKPKAGFTAFVRQAVQEQFVLRKDAPDLLVLGDWGEGYITSYESAQRVLHRIRQQGVPQNIDIFLNAGHAGRAERIRPPWVHRVTPNFGEIQLTPHGARNLPPPLRTRKRKTRRPRRACQAPVMRARLAARMCSAVHPKELLKQGLALPTGTCGSAKCQQWLQTVRRRYCGVRRNVKATHRRFNGRPWGGHGEVVGKSKDGHWEEMDDKKSHNDLDSEFKISR